MAQKHTTAELLAEIHAQLEAVRAALEEMRRAAPSGGSVLKKTQDELEDVQLIYGNKLLPRGSTREKIARSALRRYVNARSKDGVIENPAPANEPLQQAALNLEAAAETLQAAISSQEAAVAESVRSATDNAGHHLLHGQEMLINFRPMSAAPFNGEPAIKAIAFYRGSDPRSDKNELTQCILRRPLFPGHRQPLLPLDPLDLSIVEPEKIQEHSELAKYHGITAFAVDFYCLPGASVINSLADAFVELERLGVRYCLNWRIDEAHRLSDQEGEQLYATYKRHAERERYLRIGGRPMFVIETAEQATELEDVVCLIKRRAREEGSAEPYVVFAALGLLEEEPSKQAFDGFTRVNRHLDLSSDDAVNMYRNEPELLPLSVPSNAVDLYSYSGIVGCLAQKLKQPCAEFQTVHTSLYSEDGGKKTVYAFSKPEAFQSWLQRACSTSFIKGGPEHPVVFIKSWNDWGASAHLLPDVGTGYAHLTLTKQALERAGEILALRSDESEARALKIHAEGLEARRQQLADYLAEHPGKRPIILYQIGKVGSSTVIKSLRAAVHEDPVLGMHNLAHLKEGIAQAITHLPDPTEALGVLQEGIAIREWMDSAGEDYQFQVITMIKDPISRCISHFFHAVDSFWPMFRLRLEAGDITMEEVRDTFLGLFIHWKFNSWFANHFETVFPIGVPTMKYEQGKGYAIAQSPTGRYRVMVMRSEDINRVLTTACKEYLGVEVSVAKRTNTAEEKFYNKIYREFKRMPLPRWYVERMFDDKVVRNFYSEEEITRMMEKYIRGEE